MYLKNRYDYKTLHDIRTIQDNVYDRTHMIETQSGRGHSKHGH